VLEFSNPNPLNIAKMQANQKCNFSSYDAFVTNGLHPHKGAVGKRETTLQKPSMDEK
jgi:hypothetical protein